MIAENKSNYNLILILIHLILGVLMLFGFVSKLVSLAVLFFGIIFIIKSKNNNDQAIFWSAYMVGSEVLYRMSGGTYLYELPKYAVLLFLLIGLFVEKKRHHISVSFLIYMLLLLIGIAFVDIPFNASIRKAIAFNLSGPILLGVSAIYFYKRTIDIDKLLKMLFYMGLPIISMLFLLYFKTPEFDRISFSSNANFATSGGYGPNQVATILGFGGFIFVVFLFFKKRFSSVYFVDVFLLIYVTYRGLLTFSRGGMITAALAVLSFVFFFILGSKNKFNTFIKYVGIVVFSIAALGLYTSYKTDGMLTNRYTNKNSAGVVKEDFSTGRLTLFKSELDNFYEHPFFGIGVGGSKFERFEETDVLAASHNEVSRLLSEHGLIGVIVLMLLIVIPARHNFTQHYWARGLLSAFLIFWFLTINHSAMRIAFPAFIYGLSLMNITFYKSEKAAKLEN